MEPTARPRHPGRGFTRAVGLCGLVLALSGCGGGEPEVAVALTDFAFEPRQVPVQAGRRTIIRLENKGTVEHNFTVAQLQVASQPIAPGRTGRAEIAAPPGTYRLVCTIPGHEEAGMVGEVRVARR